MTDLLVWMGGGDPELLARCPTERPRFVALGGAVASTAGLATAAATCATHDWLHVSWLAAVLAGVLWGLAIMNLDRWLLIATRRQRTAVTTVLLALPRVALAIVVGLVIAEPLVLRVFNNEVTAQATATRHDEYKVARKKLDASYEQIPALEKRKSTLETSILELDSGAVLRTNPEYRAVSRQLERLQRRSAAARSAALCELDRTCGSRGGPNGAAYKAKHRLALTLLDNVRAKQKQLRALRGDLLREEAANKRRADDRARRELTAVNQQLAVLRGRRHTEDGEEFAASQADIGLLERVEALGVMTHSSVAMRNVSWLLTLFILLVDTVPIVFKTLTLLGRPTLYENVLDESDSRSFERVLTEEEQRALAHRIDTRGIVASAKNRETYTARVIDSLNEMFARTQQEVGEQAIRDWAAGATGPPPPAQTPADQPHTRPRRVSTRRNPLAGWRRGRRGADVRDGLSQHPASPR